MREYCVARCQSLWILAGSADFFYNPVQAAMEITSPNSIQPRENSMGGGIGGRRHICSRLRDSGNRLNLNFDRDGLNCDNWNWNDANSDIGCLALMV